MNVPAIPVISIALINRGDHIANTGSNKMLLMQDNIDTVHVCIKKKCKTRTFFFI